MIAALGAAIAAIMLFALVLGATGARAAELVYWDNYRDEPANTLGFANIDGSGGGTLNLGGQQFKFTEGMTYDPVTNRLYLAAEGVAPVANEGEIVYVNLDGSGAGVFSAPGAPVKSPEGIAIDLATRTLYWLNTTDNTVSFAKLDGSLGGTLSTNGATPEVGYRLAIDPSGSRLYYAEKDAAEQMVVSFVNTNNTGGGVLPITIGPSNENSVDGIAADPTTGRLYLLVESGVSPNKKGSIRYTGLGGGSLTSIPLGTNFKEGYGLAIDPMLGKGYWGNYGQIKTQTNAIGFNGINGGISGAISPTNSVPNGPQDPVIIKSPAGAGAPVLTQSKAALSCTQGTWGPDYASENVFQSPRSYAYQWSLNGTAIGGATGSALTATGPGVYACTVTATNQAGSTSQTSSTAATVTKAKFALVAKKKKAKAKPGKSAAFKVQTTNQGDLSSGKAKLCLKVPKKAKKSLKAPKCLTLKPLAAGGKKVSTVKVKVKKNAVAGSYKLQITLPNTKAAKVSLKVLG
jgi:hypothetical protein